MKNSKTLTFRAHKIRTVKHPKAQAFEEDFLIQVPPEAKRGLAGPVAVSLWIWYPSNRQDLDAAIVYDLLQKAGVILNDRQVVEKHEFRDVDPSNPRVIVQVEEKTLAIIENFATNQN